MNEIPITTLEVQNEMDVMLAHRRGMQFAKYCGISLSEQTRFGTAVSEICRNSLEYGEKASIRFSISIQNNTYSLDAEIRDEGKGIANLAEVLARRPESHRGRGIGIVYAKRLADDFAIQSTAKGTVVTLRKNIPGKNPVINKLIVQGWLKHLQNEPQISAYEELKIRNGQLMEITDQLRENAVMIENQMKEISLLNERLSGSNQKLKEFTYAISHDLKTPLNNLKLSIGFLEKLDDNAESRIYKDILTRAVLRVDKTIHSLIEIIDTQHEDKHIVRSLEFSSFFDAAKDEYAEIIRETRAEVKADFSTAPNIHYIEGYLQSIFHNLLSNSLKYREPSRTLEIDVVVRKKGSRYMMIFSDNGIGMDMEMVRDKLFRPFNRFSDQEGKGIGLYLIKGMVERNGGSVDVQSTRGQGTTFTFYLKPYE